MYTVQRKRSARKTRREINVHQNKFSKGYISTIDNSRRPTDSLSDMTNMEIVQDNVVRPRPPLVRYGTQPSLPVIGRGNIRYGGDRSLLFMLNDTGTGKIALQTDGGTITSLGGSYDHTAWAGFVQAQGRAFPFNGVDNLSYVDLSDNSIHTYTALATPAAPTVVMTGATSTGFTYYYRITANNDVGESIRSTAGSDVTNKPRDNWVDGTDYMTITWSSVPNATSYTVYVGDSVDNCNELYTTTALTFVDYGTLSTNPFKLAPEGNSTEGAIFDWMYVDTKNSQIFGVSSVDNKLYYSAPGTGDFSPYNGGGWVAIDDAGDTQLNYVDGFRNGKGDPVITVSARGAAGKGKLFHVSFEQLTVGTQIIIFPNVYEANGQSGTYSARGTIKSRDALTYFTGQDVKTTGTSQNIVNILTTLTVSQVIEPDMANVNLENLHKSAGLEYRDRQYWALPVGSDENNEIWYRDQSRNNLWVLRWTVAAVDIWLYEDNNGVTHFCALVDNEIMEFTRTGGQTHQDGGVAFSSRVAFSSLVWDEDGITMGKIRRQYFKFLNPKGTVNVSTTGLSRRGISLSVGSDSFTVSTTPTGVGVWLYSDGHQYGENPGTVNTYGKSVAILEIKPRGLLAEMTWEVTADTVNADYVLSAVNTRGFALDELILRS